ncbi:MAG TPA: hypothetical protein VFY14_13580 [Streptomyces sp.]|nr:hypothetical protein [Streptomyces sp.]
MGAGDDTTRTAAARLRLLGAEFTTPRRAARPAAPPTPRPAHSAAPVDLGVVDHMAATLRELVTHARAANPQAGPPPEDGDDVYQWWSTNTAHLDGERARHRDALVHRQALEHAIRLGEETVIRRIPCPGCRCWGLFWRPASQRAVCVNRHCRPGKGPSVWTLRQLAEYQVDRRERGQRTAT